MAESTAGVKRGDVGEIAHIDAYEKRALQVISISTSVRKSRSKAFKVEKISKDIHSHSRSS